MCARHGPIQHRYVNPHAVRDPVRELLWDVTEQFDAIKPVLSWRWLYREGGVDKFG
jgi:hypothetical protein